MNNIYTGVLILALVAFCTSIGYSQSGKATETTLLEQQLNSFSAVNKKQAGNEKFEFDGCRCKYTHTGKADQEGFNMSKTNSFDLQEVSSVSYAKNDDATYELRIKLKTDDNTVTQLLDLSSINFLLYTSDEKQVKEIASRFKQAVKTCSNKQ